MQLVYLRAVVAMAATVRFVARSSLVNRPARPNRGHDKGNRSRLGNAEQRPPLFSPAAGMRADAYSHEVFAASGSRTRSWHRSAARFHCSEDLRHAHPRSQGTEHLLRKVNQRNWFARHSISEC